MTVWVDLGPRSRRYSAGQRFGPHVDEPVRSSDGSMESEFTLLLYLNGGPHSWGGPLKVRRLHNVDTSARSTDLQLLVAFGLCSTRGVRPAST